MRRVHTLIVCVVLATIATSAGCASTPSASTAPSLDEPSPDALRAAAGDRGFEIYGEAVQENPGDEEAWFRLGMMFLGAGDRERAHQCFARTVAMAPAHFDACLHLARCENDVDQAIEYYDRAIVLDSDDPRPWEWMARTLGAHGRDTEAIEAFHAAAALNPDRPSFNLGVALAEWGRYDGAIDVFDEVISLAPKSRNARLARGICLFRLERDEEALDAFDRAAALDPYGRRIIFGKANPEVHLWRALVLDRMGRHDDAEDARAIARRLHQDELMAGQLNG